MPSLRGHYPLGCAHYVIGETRMKASALETVMRLAPPHRPAMLMLASVQLKMRNCAAARSTAEAIVAAPDERGNE
jgi:hypothetical protein